MPVPRANENDQRGTSSGTREPQEVRVPAGIASEFKVAIKKLERDLRMGTSQRARLDAEVLLLSASSSKLLLEGSFYGLVPCRIPEPIGGHRPAS